MGPIAVIGGGASGVLQALHLKRRGAEVALIDRGPHSGRGVAYGTARPEHLLNVPARRMSAFSDAPDHFVRWYGARAGGGEEDFAPRMLYGDYLAERLDEAGIVPLAGEAVALDEGGVTLADGRRIAADAFVLAPGNFRPALPPGIDPAALGPAWIGDPWAGDFAAGLGPRDVVLLIGTGLTAVDVALTLDARGFPGRVVALSRRGLAPRAHEPLEPVVTPPGETLDPGCVAMLRRVRARSDEIGWHAAVHELRGVTQALWASADLAERRRFLRHLRAWWDVHRHRLAPAIGARIEALQAEARLAIAAGKLVSAEAAEGGAIVRFRPRGRAGVETLRVARIVNCTGPELDIVRAGEPLLAGLLAAGRIRPDKLAIGIDVDAECRALDAGGQASETLSVIGPVTRGAFWESVAVPDIRGQAERVAARLGDSYLTVPRLSPGQ